MLVAGVDVNRVNHQGVTPLHQAVASQREPVVAALLAAGIRPQPNTLHVATRLGYDDIALLLISSGMIFYSRVIVERCLLQLVVMCSHLQDHAGASPNVADEDGLTATQLAALRHDPGMLKALVEKGGDLAVRDARGASLLHLACKVGVPATVQYLLGHGASATDTDSSGATPLHVLGSGNNNMLESACAIIADLVAAGAGVDAENSMRVSPLGTACAGGNVPLATQLMRVGAKSLGSGSASLPPAAHACFERSIALLASGKETFNIMSHWA